MLKICMTRKWLHLCLGFILVCSTAGEEVHCPDPGVSIDGNREGSCCLVGDLLRYSCNEDFELVGPRIIECLLIGNWTFLRPLCRPLTNHCTLPPAISHGVVEGSKDGDYYLPYDAAVFRCNTGYSHPQENTLIECDEEGEWEAEFGECTKILCDPPDPIKNGAIKELLLTNLTRFPFHFDLTYVCDKGFRLIGENSWRLCESFGWSGMTPYCEEIRCGAPITLNNGTITELQFTNLTSFPLNFELTYICDKGFRLVGGDSSRFCDIVGWSGMTPHCEEIHCDPPELLRNGTITELQFTNLTIFPFNFELTYVCDKGFRLIGGDSWRFCDSNGWSGRTRHCEMPQLVIKCPDPGVPDYGARSGNSSDVGSTVHFKCFNGDKLIGSFRPNGQWTGELAQCDKELSESATEQERKLNEDQDCLFASSSHRFIGSASGYIPMNCPGILVLYFVFDVSSKVGEENFKRSIDFAKAFVKRVGITEAGARAGALTFSSEVLIQFMPPDFNTTEGVLDGLDKIEYTGGGSTASESFRYIRQEMIPVTKILLEKKRQKSIVFILTNGRANMGGDPQVEAQTLKDAGVEIYCIGITDNFKMETLQNIASEPKTEHVFILNHYQSLAWLVQKLINGTVDYSQCGLGMEAVGNRMSRAQILRYNKAPDPWPWMAALYFSRPGMTVRVADEKELNCGGSIIDEYFILTSAECTLDRSERVTRRREKKEFIVKLGLNDLKNETFLQKPEVKHIYIHPEHLSGSNIYDYDVALLQLRTPIEFNAYVRPICLPPKDLPARSTLYKPNERGVVTGWGHQDGNSTLKMSDHLKEIILPIQSRNRCLQSIWVQKQRAFTDRMFCVGYGNDLPARITLYKPNERGVETGWGHQDGDSTLKMSNHLKEITLPIQSRHRCLQSIWVRKQRVFTDRMFCVGDGNGTGTCSGDGGGPLMQSQINNEGYRYWTQVGINSWRINCGKVNSFEFYTHVQKLRDWINETIKNAKEEDF